MNQYTSGTRMRASRRWLRLPGALVGFALLTSSVGCRDKRTHEQSPNQKPAIGYERAAWRLVTFQELDRTVLWVSHIVVMHRASQLSGTLLRAPGWTPDPKLPERSEQEALSRALEIAALAAKNPGGFADLAKRYSDDIVTRDRGGSLGGIRATQLPPEYRDALARLRSSEVSRVLRTSFGFHVIQRRPVPAEAAVAGKRIVIRYQGTFGGPNGVPSTRTRHEALTLARQVAEEARRDTQRFDELVDRYSEHVDKIQRGDLGLWSVRDPGYLSQEIERLAELAVGEVSEPLDSRLGFEILMRTDAAARSRYAMEAIELRFDPTASVEHAASKASVHKRALRILSDLHNDESQFARLQQQECCAGTKQWTSGRGPLGVEPVIDRLPFGAIAAAPIESDWVFVIPRRLDPSTLPEAPKPTYELPAPASPDFDRIVAASDGTILAGNVRMLAGELQRALHLEARRMRALKSRLDQLALSFEKEWSTPEERVAGWHRALSGIRAELGPDDYARFERFLKEWATRMLMSLKR
jgi:hypothetical protein